MIQPIKLGLSGDGEERMAKFLGQKIRALRRTLQELHETRLPMWRRAYEAVPAETVREFPWHGASNLVVPIIAIHADTLLARVMAAIFKTSPLWVARLIGKYPKEAMDFKMAYEAAMGYVGLEPTELDLYRVYHEWLGEGIKLGTSILKCPWTTIKEDFPIQAGDGEGIKYYSDIIYEGPRPEKLPFNDFLMDPTFKTIELADFKCHRIRYTSRQAIEELGWRGIYDKAKVMDIIGKPDRTSPDSVTTQQLSDAGVTISGGDAGVGYEEYDVYECHFKYRITRGRFVKCIVWYNELNNKILRAYYNYYPTEIFIANRLFYRDDYFFGYGFCETLATFQEELSQIHNGRRDNMTVSNTVVWRVGNDSLINKGYRLFPSAMIPAGKDELEPLQAGQVSPVSIDEERLTLELAEKRSGVSAPMQGMGSGTMSKRGVYSSMGTLSLLQEGNTRTDLNITDMRYAHTKLGRVLSQEYAEFGFGQRAQQFGLDAQNILAAFDAIKAKKMCLPIYAATASVNREVEKQSDLMLTGVMQKHHQMIGQMLQAASNQFCPPEQQKYLYGAIENANTLMKLVFLHFGYDEVDRFVTDVEPAQPPQGGLGGAPQLPPQQGPTGGVPQEGGGQPGGGQPGSGQPQVGLPPALAAMMQGGMGGGRV